MGTVRRIESDLDVFKTTRVVEESKYVIASISDDEREELLDLTSSFSIFNLKCYGLIVSTILVFTFIFRVLKPLSWSVINQLGSFIGQNYRGLFERGAKCLLTLLWLLFTFFVVHFFTGSIKTELVQKYPADRIKNLNDLAESSLTPKFSGYNPIYDLFKSAMTKDYEKIWSKCNNNENFCVSRNSEDENQYFLDFVYRKAALIGSQETELKTLNELVCIRKLDKGVKNLFKRYVVSEPFVSKQSGIVMNRDVKENMKTKLDEL